MGRKERRKMKQMKKVMALLLALAMVMGSMSLTAFAADPNGSVTVDNATVGEVYKIFKVFDLSYSGDGETSTGTEGGDPAYEGVAYSYTKVGQTDAFLTALQGNDSPFTLTETTTAGKYNVAIKSGKTGTDIAEFLKANESKLPEITNATTTGLDGNKKATATTVKWSGLGYGYYYVTSGLGAVVTIDSTLKDVKVKDKNSVPSEDKKQSATEGSGYADDNVSVKIGDKVYYEVTVTDGKGTDQAITLTDTMSTGLTNNKDYVLYKNSVSDENKIATSNYTISSEDDHSFKITLGAAYVASLNNADKVIVRYSATLNENAVTKSEETTDPDNTNKNTMKLEYSNQSQTDSVTVETYKFQLVKDNTKDEVLTGATFKLYDKATGGNEIPVVKVSDGVYRVAKAGETGVLIEAGKPEIRGLAKGTAYYVEEIDAPEGYNALTERKSITLSADNMATITTGTPDKYVSGGLEVENQQGTELPSTGGIGTTIFYILGAGLVIGAVVMLVARKKAEKKAE